MDERSEGLRLLRDLTCWAARPRLTPISQEQGQRLNGRSLPRPAPRPRLDRARIEAALGRTEQARQDFQRALAELWAMPRESRAYLAPQFDITRSEIEESEDRAAALATEIGDRFEDVLQLIKRADLEFRLSDTSAAERNLERALGELERERARIVPGGYRTSYLEQAQPLYERMVALQVNLGRTEKALSVLERFRARSLLDQLQAVSAKNGEGKLAATAAAPMDSAELRRRLPTRTLVAVYAVVDGHLVTWLIGAAGIEISPEQPLWAAVSSMVEHLGETRRQDSVVANKILEHLHGVLVAPWRDRLGESDRLVFVPTRSLYRVPFAALRDRESGRFLVQDHAVGIAPSASEFLAAVERDRHLAGGPIERVLLVGDPVNPLPPLPGSVREIASLTQVYQGLDALVLLRQDAAPRRVLASLAAADLVHMAVHAVEEAGDLSRSRLALSSVGSDRGHLPLGDILRLHLPRTRLVVLAACDTNRGPVSPSEGPMSLAAAFLSSGVPAVVASLSPVEDESTRRLSVRFHQELRRGADALSALRTAQLAEIEMNPERFGWTWASFQVFGGVVERKAPVPLPAGNSVIPAGKVIVPAGQAIQPAGKPALPAGTMP